MIQLASHDLCNGCQACGSVCPKEAITFGADAEGFLHPTIDAAKCIACHRCEKACPVLVPNPPRKPLAVYAAIAKDDVVRAASSSGGVFTLLARRTIAAGGIVYGAAIRESDLMVAHCSAETEDELARLRGSKYVQSDVGDVYRQVKAQLATGRQVLFSGTPCQIAALRRVLGRPCENLLCVDFICHAVPSPLAWRKYLESRVRACAEGSVRALAEGIIAKRISFRRKDCGWKRYSLSLCFAKDKEYLADLQTDPFLRGFLAELYNRPSCHQCACRELRSGADLTLGDYWNVHQRYPEMDDDRGTSVILVNTSAGEAALASLRGELRLQDSDFADICRTNPASIRSSSANPHRVQFFRALVRSKDFDRLVTRLLKRTLFRKLGSYVKRVLRKHFGR